jgi:hypothetical protein
MLSNLNKCKKIKVGTDFHKRRKYSRTLRTCKVCWERYFATSDVVSDNAACLKRPNPDQEVPASLAELNTVVKEVHCHESGPAHEFSLLVNASTTTATIVAEIQNVDRYSGFKCTDSPVKL